MVIMIRTAVLAAIAILQVAVVATQDASRVGDACVTSGEKRCDASARVLSVCGEDGAWTQVEDCAAHGRVCFDGRCLDTNLTRPDDKCKGKEGSFICDACKKVCFCNNYGVLIQIEDCGGKWCDETTHTCVSDESACVTNGKDDLCDDDGIYPDLTNCQRYIACNGGKKSIVKACYGATNWNPCTLTCTDDESFDCKDFNKKCTEEDEPNVYPFPANPSLYYNCINGIRTWRRCEKGFFVYNYGKCYAENFGEICLNPGTSNEVPCTAENVGKKYPVKNSTCHYYVCQDDEIKHYKTCASGYYFNAALGEVVPGPCSET